MKDEKSLKASEGISMGAVIYIRKQGTQIGVKEGRIEIREQGESIQSFPIKQVDTVNIFGGIDFTTPFIKNCNDEGITLNYFTLHGKYQGSYIPEKNTIAHIRENQYSLERRKKIEISNKFIYGKIRNMKTILMRKDIEIPESLNSILKKLKENDLDIKTLRAKEGEATKLYFQLLNKCLRNGWEFKKRTKRPPEDHFNSLLSLSYTMIKNEVLSGLRQYNLDPFLGIMHVNKHGRPALALDLMEEFRPLYAGSFAIRLINRRTLTHDDFRNNNRLKEQKMKEYLSKFEDYMNEEFRHPNFEYQTSRRKSIQMQAILLRKTITGEHDEYHPLVFLR